MPLLAAGLAKVSGGRVSSGEVHNKRSRIRARCSSDKRKSARLVAGQTAIHER